MKWVNCDARTARYHFTYKYKPYFSYNLKKKKKRNNWLKSKLFSVNARIIHIAIFAINPLPTMGDSGIAEDGWANDSGRTCIYNKVLGGWAQQTHVQHSPDSSGTGQSQARLRQNRLK
jgi:hypothetical protein